MNWFEKHLKIFTAWLCIEFSLNTQILFFRFSPWNKYKWKSSEKSIILLSLWKFFRINFSWIFFFEKYVLKPLSLFSDGKRVRVRRVWVKEKELLLFLFVPPFFISVLENFLFQYRGPFQNAAHFSQARRQMWYECN